MKNLVKHIESRVSLTQEEINLIEKYFLVEKTDAHIQSWPEDFSSDHDCAIA